VAGRTSADDDVGKKTRNFLFMGLKDNVDRLQRGVFRASGRYADQVPDTADLEGDVTLFCAFDYSKGWFRFDRSEPRRLTSDAKSKTWTLQYFGGKFARTPEGSVQWHLGSHAADFRNPSEPASNLIRPFDIRCLGLYTGVSLDKGYSVDEMIAAYSSYEHQVVVKSKNKNHELSFVGKPYAQNPLGDVQTVIWFDENRGFSPIRSEWRERDPKNLDRWKPSVEVNETTYQLVADVWVPRTYRTEWKTEKVRKCLELAFEWESVNQPVRAELFTKEGLELKTGTMYMDTQTGKPIVVGAAGVKNFPKFGPEGPIYDAPSYAWLFWTCAVLAGVAILLGLYWYRRRARG
jgi:hypothetical protein